MVEFDLAAAIRARRVSCVEVMTACLDQIDRVNPTVNAIVALRDQHAPNAGLLLLHGAAPTNDPAGLDRLREYEARARAALEDAPRASILYLSSLWQPRLDHEYTLMSSDPDGWLTDGVHMSTFAHSQVADLILAAVRG